MPYSSLFATISVPVRALSLAVRIGCQRPFTCSTCTKNDDSPLKRLADLAQTLSKDAQVGSNAETDRNTTLPAFSPRIWPSNNEPEENMLHDIDTLPPTQGTASRHRWTSDEKRRLLAIVKQCRQSSTGPVVWPDVQERFKHRSLIACREVYYKIKRQQATRIDGDDRKPQRQKYATVEIQKLNELVRKYGEHSWTKVAQEMEAATGISRHKGVYLSIWNSTLCPKAQSAPPWTAERTERLQELVGQHGPDPVFLAYKFFPEYTPYIIKARIARLRQPTVDKQDH
ncbi:hypothetical protein GGI03_002046 [Coemansia sp. RSA 2337]|nr:hypothetical protein GGI03_002046 [Coemansia sp. RSA 2337]